MKTLAEELFDTPDQETIETVILKLERAAKILQDALQYSDIDERRVDAAIELLEGTYE